MTQDRRSLWLAWGLWHHFWLGLLTAFFGSMATLSTYLDHSGNLSYRIARLWGRFMLRVSRTTVQVEGLEYLHPDQTYVFASNHRSNFDIYVLLAILPYRFLWVARST